MFQKDGNFLESNEKIEQHVLSYFQELFASENMCSPTNIISKTIPAQITQANNDIFPKQASADKIDQLRPLALASFQFRLITKILAR